MSSVDPVVSVAVRTPHGRFQGELAAISASSPGASVIRAALERAARPPGRIDEVFMGCVLPAGQASARRAMRVAGLLDEVRATNVDKVCGSGMKAVMIAWPV